MKQLTVVRARVVEWWDVPEPVLTDPRDALVRPLVVSRCDGDSIFLFRDVGRLLQAGVAAHLLDERLLDDFGARPFAPPIALGHECVAEVLSVGPEVRRVQPGDLVVVPFQVSCGSCPQCLRGNTGSCSIETQRTPFAVYGFGAAGGNRGGALSDVLRVPYADHMMVTVPVGVDATHVAAAGDNLTDGWRTVAHPLRDDPGAEVIIFGGRARSVGLYAAATAVALGSTRVDYLDGNDERLSVAERLGANPITVRSRRDIERLAEARRGAYPISVDASGRPGALQAALRVLRPGGICTSVFWYLRRRTPVPLWQVYSGDLQLRAGRVHARHLLPDVLDLVAGGRLRPDLVTTRHAPWEEAAEAMLDPTTKVVVSRAPLTR